MDTITKFTCVQCWKPGPTRVSGVCVCVSVCVFCVSRARRCAYYEVGVFRDPY